MSSTSKKKTKKERVRSFPPTEDLPLPTKDPSQLFSSYREYCNSKVYREDVEKNKALEDEEDARQYYKKLLEHKLSAALASPQQLKDLHSKWKPYELCSIPKWDETRSGCMYPLQWRPIPQFHFTWGEYIIMLILVPGLAVIASVSGGEGSGSVAVIPMALVYALASRNSIWTFFLGIPFERALIYHKACAWSTVICGAIHWGLLGGEANGSGVVMIASFGALLVFSLGPIRRKFFEVFYFLHWIFFVVAAIAGLAHGAGAFMIGMVLWIADVAIRAYLALIRNPRKITIVRCPSNVVRISFDKPEDFNYKGGQYLFICIPELGYFQWHPFSLSSSPWESQVHLHVRVLGNWTQSLYDLADDEKLKRVDAYIEGPYGEPTTDVDSDRYKCFLLVSGGIGVTPMQSICNQLLFEFARGRKLVKIWFVWAVRDKFMMEAVLKYNAEYYEGNMNYGRLPKSFSPDMLVSHSVTLPGVQQCQDSTELEKDNNVIDTATAEKRKGDPLHSEFYLTRARDANDFDDAGIHPGAQPSLRFGRPKLPVIFDKMKEIAKEAGEERVAALCCGPDVIIDEMKRLSKSKSGDGVTFDVHCETFLF